MPPEPLALSAITTVSAMGAGRQALLASLLAGRSGLRPNDFDGQGWIGRVDGLESHVLPTALTAFDCRNNRLADMALQAGDVPAAAAAAARRYGADRVAVVLGTSTSGVGACEEAYAARGPDGALPASFDYEHTHDMASSARFVRAALGMRGPALVVSVACTSASRAVIDAANLIRAGLCDAAVVGGVDTLCRLTLQGFASLDLISPDPCRPCDAARTGISIGEAAGFALLTRGEGELRLLGAGSTSDGHHMSSPHPEGLGAAGAMRGALASAGLASADVDWVCLHGTATRANDAMEDMAVGAVFGPGMACSSIKGGTGHTLGACGMLGVAVAELAIERGFRPGCIGLHTADPSFQAHVPLGNEAASIRRVAVNAFGFGGANCTLLVGSA